MDDYGTGETFDLEAVIKLPPDQRNKALLKEVLAREALRPLYAAKGKPFPSTENLLMHMDTGLPTTKQMAEALILRTSVQICDSRKETAILDEAGGGDGFIASFKTTPRLLFSKDVDGLDREMRACGLLGELKGVERVVDIHTRFWDYQHHVEPNLTYASKYGKLLSKFNRSEKQS